MGPSKQVHEMSERQRHESVNGQQPLNKITQKKTHLSLAVVTLEAINYAACLDLVTQF